MVVDILTKSPRLVGAGLFALAALTAVPALAVDPPTAPGGDWVEPEYREAGDAMVFGGPGAYVGTIGGAGFDAESIDVIPGLDFGMNLHLGNNVALTGRTGASWDGDHVTIPAVGGVRLQFPFGVSTFAFGPEAGVAWSMVPEGEDRETTSNLVGAFRVSYEYAFEGGWTLGADASLNTYVDVGTFPRAALKLGYEF